jgi:hypothetical protein
MAVAGKPTPTLHWTLTVIWVTFPTAIFDAAGWAFVNRSLIIYWHISCFFLYLATTLRGTTLYKTGICKLCHFRERVPWSYEQSWPGSMIPVLQRSQARIPSYQATNIETSGNREKNFICWLSVQKAGLAWCEIRSARVRVDKSRAPLTLYMLRVSKSWD